MDQKDKVNQGVKADPEDKGTVRGLVERVDLKDGGEPDRRIQVTWVTRVEVIELVIRVEREDSVDLGDQVGVAQ